MAEKSSELEINRTDENENLLEVPNDNRALTTTEDFDAEAALAETAETDDAQQIREQIEETRSQMSGTIDAIQERLSVANITEQVKDQVSEQITGAVETAKDAVYGRAHQLARSVGKSFAQIGNSDLARKAQKNPWLFSVVGMSIGAALVGALVSSGGGGKKSKRKAAYRYKSLDFPQTRQRFETSGENDFETQNHETKTSGGIVRPSEFVSKSDSKSESKLDSKSNEETGEHRTDAKSSTLSNVTSAAGSAYKNISSAAGKTYETVGKASGYAYDKAGDLGDAAMKNYKHYIEENPLAVGAVALAVGAVVGYAIPLTQTENQYFGEVRDKLMDKAQTSAQDAIGTVKQAVGDARQLIADEVKSQTASK